MNMAQPFFTGVSRIERASGVSHSLYGTVMCESSR